LRLCFMLPAEGSEDGMAQLCKEMHFLLGAVAHACNPSYSGGRDQEDRGSKLVTVLGTL
jgi:hypothetical protein